MRQIIERNLRSVRTRMQRACSVAHRSPQDVALIAVTKYAEWEWVRLLAEWHHEFGENRPQQLADRQPQMSGETWHLIGQLQANKCRQAVLHANMIHSVDSVRLLRRIVRVAGEENRELRLQLQVNVSGESSKSGFSVSELIAEWPTLCAAVSEGEGEGVRLSGLMTMAPLTEDTESTRPVFRQLRDLRDQLNVMACGPALTDLSMGMSRDFEVAIAEGATHIRVGSSLFDGVPAPSEPPGSIRNP